MCVGGCMCELGGGGVCVCWMECSQRLVCGLASLCFNVQSRYGTGIFGFVLVLPYKGKRMGTAAGWVPDFLCLSSVYWCILVLLPLLIFVG